MNNVHGEVKQKEVWTMWAFNAVQSLWVYSVCCYYTDWTNTKRGGVLVCSSEEANSKMGNHKSQELQKRFSLVLSPLVGQWFLNNYGMDFH